MSKIDRTIARNFPDLGRPVMPKPARKALQTLMRYEKSISGFAYDKGYIADISEELTLAWARGFVCDPEDWTPTPTPKRMHARYQPWAEWMAENGLIRLFTSCTLTRDNWHLWKPDETRQEIGYLLKYDPEKAYDLLLHNAVDDSPAHRERMMWQFARQYAPYAGFEASITRELETGELPVNWSYDPCRSLGLVVDKPTAEHLLERALNLGMAEDHPRLSPLQFNIAL